MISKENIEIVQSTVPVLETSISKITQVFYQRLFKNHPQLKNVFNMTHQAKGSQPEALARAVFMYARHIAQPAVLEQAIAAIAEKHVSLNVTPAQYEVVGTNLLAAIQEVLGKDVATPTVINAWAEAYHQLAQLLINVEEQRYAKRASAIGGFRGQKSFIITQKVKESQAITSFYLKPKDGQPAPRFIPGQYIAITVDIPGENHQHTRNYSLSSVYTPDYLRISIKKEGLVSNYLHDQINVGDEVLAGIPAGVFTLKDAQAPVVLIAGGVGITPLFSMYQHLVQHTQRKVAFIQCALNSQVHAFKDEIYDLANDRVQAITIYDQPVAQDQLNIDYDYKGLLNVEILSPLISPQTQFYFCGPEAFMRHVMGLLSLLGVNDDRIFYEFFGPSGTLEKPTTDHQAIL
ncbi:nitric oxide dioxygenase [marine bacterium AO1-C]|nr:nitric oxide dioxygenase [marine bacterium AO1-C]